LYSLLAITAASESEAGSKHQLVEAASLTSKGSLLKNRMMSDLLVNSIIS
jgi:hypothetical protein